MVIIFPRVIVITGTPSVGKTTVSKALTEKLGGLYINLNDIVKEENLVLSVDSERGTTVADLDKLRDRVNKLVCATSLDVIVEGHYAAIVVPPNLVSYSFVLRMEPYKLEEMLRARGYTERKVLENIASEILDICLVDALREYGLERVDEVDVTNMRIEDVVEEILKVLGGNRKCKAGVVNWLEKLDEKGKLEYWLVRLNKI
ncbi:MAG: adenylate kinase family protein [Candidatus Bathyarchaeota archaeon]